MRAGRFIGLAALAFSLALPARAQGPTVDAGADAFLNFYVGLCVKRFDDFAAFRARLLSRKLPKLEAKDAAFFLNGAPGEAWPIPYQGRQGNFVLALPAGKNLCTLYARRTDVAGVRKGFLEMVGQAPAPMVAQRQPEREVVTAANGKARTVSSVWAPPGARRKVQFMLTTAASSTAELQAMASVAVIGEGPASKARPTRKPAS